MALYNFIESLLWFVVGFQTWVLQNLGYNVSLFGKDEAAPWFLGWPLSIWIIVMMFISIIMMVKRAVRFVTRAYRTMS